MSKEQAKQILEKHRQHLLTVTDYEAILAAMQEYSDLRAKGLVEALKKIKNISNWLSDERDIAAKALAAYRGEIDNTLKQQ